MVAGTHDERDAEEVIDAVVAELGGVAEPSPTEIVGVVVRRVLGGKVVLGDPSEEHLARLRDRYPNVRKGSACERGRDVFAHEAATGAQAVVFDVGPIEWRGEEAARVPSGFSRGGLHTVELEHDLVKRDGVWTVERTARTRMI